MKVFSAALAMAALAFIAGLPLVAGAAGMVAALSFLSELALRRAVGDGGAASTSATPVASVVPALAGATTHRVAAAGSLVVSQPTPVTGMFGGAPQWPELDAFPPSDGSVSDPEMADTTPPLPPAREAQATVVAAALTPSSEPEGTPAGQVEEEGLVKVRHVSIRPGMLDQYSEVARSADKSDDRGAAQQTSVAQDPSFDSAPAFEAAGPSLESLVAAESGWASEPMGGF